MTRQNFCSCRICRLESSSKKLKSESSGTNDYFLMPMTLILNLGTQSQETANLGYERFERSKSSSRNAELSCLTSRKNSIRWLRTRRKNGTKVVTMLFSLVVGVTAVLQNYHQKQTQMFTRSIRSRFPRKTFSSRKRKKAKSEEKNRKKFLRRLVWCFR